jgi:hypothetical protein
MKSRAHGHHELELFSYSRERSGRRPRIERWRLNPFDVVEKQFRDQRDVVANLLTALSEAFYVSPRRLHSFIGNVAKPAAENRQPISESHHATPAGTRASVLIPARSMR